MIAVKLIGGLGNQMFQYALGRHLSIKNNCDLYMDINEFETYKLHKYSLQHFQIKENFLKLEDVPKKSFFYRFKFINTGVTQEREFNFSKNILDTKAPNYLEGFWQSELYFNEIRETLLKDFEVEKPLTGKNLEVFEEIKGVESISLHIRRGDYVSNQQTNSFHGTCSLNYYKRALDYISDEKPDDLNIFAFSDDPQWVKENLKTEIPIRFVDHNDADTNFEDLRLMSLCKNNIIANSTFSWWGAWLNQNSEKIVIAPQRWFNNDKVDTSDVVPNSWTKI